MTEQERKPAPDRSDDPLSRFSRHLPALQGVTLGIPFRFLKFGFNMQGRIPGARFVFPDLIHHAGALIIRPFCSSGFSVRAASDRPYGMGAGLSSAQTTKPDFLRDSLYTQKSCPQINADSFYNIRNYRYHFLPQSVQTAVTRVVDLVFLFVRSGISRISPQVITARKIHKAQPQQPLYFVFVSVTGII